jgi:hypothetical protein
VDSPATVEKMLASGEVWGTFPFKGNSNQPAVQAYRGDGLLPGEHGVVFYTSVKPHSEFGPVVYWYGAWGQFPGTPGVTTEGDWAKIPAVFVYHNP